MMNTAHNKNCRRCFLAYVTLSITEESPVLIIPILNRFLRSELFKVKRRKKSVDA